MSDENTPCKPRPEADLRAVIMDINIAKSESEWWAYHRIAELEAENKRLQHCHICKPDIALESAMQEFLDSIEEHGELEVSKGSYTTLKFKALLGVQK